MQTTSHPRYLIFFAMLVTALIPIGILAQYRLFPVPHIGDISATTLSYPFLCLAFDMIAELYGFRTSRKILWLGFISASIMMWVLYAFSQLSMPTILHPIRTHLYNQAFHHFPRVYFDDSMGLLVSQYLNVYFFGLLQKRFKTQFFIFRSLVSTWFSDLFCAIVSLFGDYAHMGFTGSHLLMMSIEEVTLGYCIGILIPLPANILIRYLKNIEPTPNFSVSFNPFK